MTSFTQKSLEVHLILAEGSFRNQDNANRKIIRGLPMEVSCTKAGEPDRHNCSIRIKNMLMEDMEQLTTLGSQDGKNRRNLVDVILGDGSGSILFSGEIESASADFSSVPDVSLVISGVTGIYPAMVAASPMAVKGTAPLTEVMRQLAMGINYGFVDEGFTGQLRNSVLLGSPLEKIQQAAKEAGAGLIIDDRVVILKDKKTPRKGGGFLLSASSGMIGYPTFENDRIKVEALYNPELRYGHLFEIQSVVPKASGKWIVVKLAYQLNVNEGGKESWKMTVHGRAYEQ